MRQRLIDVARNQNGSALVEITLVIPVVMALMLGILVFGILFYNYILVTRAAELGARTLSISRLDSTPFTDTKNAVNTAATNISGLTITMSVNTVVCTSDLDCQGRLKTAYNTFAVPPEEVSVQVSYDCTGAYSILSPYFTTLRAICPLITMHAAVE